MLRKGSVGFLRHAVQCGLQQPVQQSVQQSCVQLQVLNLQAIRFRSKPSAYREPVPMFRSFEWNHGLDFIEEGATSAGSYGHYVVLQATRKCGRSSPGGRGARSPGCGR